MKYISLFVYFALCLCCLTACTDVRKSAPVVPEMGGDAGVADSAGAAEVSEAPKRAGRGLVAWDYDLLSCDIAYAPGRGDAALWTERQAYAEEVSSIDVFAYVATGKSLSFGRSWTLEKWDGNRWADAEWRVGGFISQDDAMAFDTIPLLLCFRVPVGNFYYLSKGRYRIGKDFRKDGKKLSLWAEFVIY